MFMPYFETLDLSYDYQYVGGSRNTKDEYKKQDGGGGVRMYTYMVLSGRSGTHHQ